MSNSKYAAVLFSLVAWSFASSASEAAAWVRVGEFDSNLSFATPCSAAELVLSGDRDETSTASRTPLIKRATCDKDGVRFVVEITDGSNVGGVKGLFDGVADAVVKDPQALGKSSARQIDGHRAVFSYGKDEGLIGAKGFVEIGPAKIALVMAGGNPEKAPSVEAQRAAVSQFVDSLRVQN